MKTENRQTAVFGGGGWPGSYSKEWLRLDLIAGLTAAAVVIPKAMAYATIAGLPVQVGLYTAFVPMIIYALLGTSRPLSVSTTTTIAILAGAQLGLVVPDGDPGALLAASATLTLLVGGILVAASILRLGFVATVNTDNRLMSNVSPSSEMHAVATTFDLSWGEAEQLVVNGIDAAFAPMEQRRRLIDEVVRPAYRALALSS